MHIQKVAPELRPIYQFLPAIHFQNRFLQFLMRSALKLADLRRRVKGVKIEKHRVGAAGLRIYQPPQGISGSALLWMHGGGFIIGSAAQDHSICSTYARDLKMVVVSVDYHLAPEHPFPAALDDCFAAWMWLLDAAPDLGVDPARIAIGGMSAGGGLAACLAQRIVDSGGRQPAAQLLIYPMLDDRTAADHKLDELKHYLWNNRNNRGGWGAYLGAEPGQSDPPDYAVPARRIDLTGLPPVRIGVGDIDLFYNENRAYAERLTSAGVACELDLVPMAPHGFQVVAPRAAISQAFNERNIQFLKRTLGLKQGQN